MKKVFPEYGIELVEIQRKEMEETPISASFVRKCMAEKDYETIKKIVPQSTYDYIISDEGKSLL